jgi:hypothetical protein
VVDPERDWSKRERTTTLPRRSLSDCVLPFTTGKGSDPTFRHTPLGSNERLVIGPPTVRSTAGDGVDAGHSRRNHHRVRRRVASGKCYNRRRQGVTVAAELPEFTGRARQPRVSTDPVRITNSTGYFPSASSAIESPTPGSGLCAGRLRRQTRYRNERSRAPRVIPVHDSWMGGQSVPHSLPGLLCALLRRPTTTSMVVGPTLLDRIG